LKQRIAAKKMKSVLDNMEEFEMEGKEGLSGRDCGTVNKEC